MVLRKYLMTGALCVSFVYGASEDRRLQLERVPTETHEAVIKQGYAFAQAQVSDGELSGTVPELYAEILEKGYQAFLDTYRDIEQRALEILDLFNNPVAEDLPEVKAAADAFDAAAGDPTNVDLWVDEFKLFSVAILKLVNSRDIKGFKAHPETAERIILNNKLNATAEERIEIAGHMAAVTARFSQRYNIMGDETFVAFRKKVATVVATLPKPE